MGILAMAAIAVGGGVRDRRDLANLMLERGMARDTFDLMVRYMVSVDELGGVFGDNDFRFVVAFQALSLRDMGIPLNHAEMTLLASNPSVDILPVIKVPTLDVDIAFGCDMAGGATPDRTGDAVFFSLWPGLVVMADETVDFVNREVSTLNDLGVAGGAAEFHTPPKLLKVFPVREGHVFIDHICFEIVRLVASLLKTGRIADLCMRLTGLLP
jgi:hypothetical protein